MSLDLQIPFSLLNSLVQDQLQQKLNTTCFPPFPDDDGETTYVDSVTVQSVSHIVDSTVIDFPTTAQLLLVSQSDLDNSVGGLTPDRIVLSAQLALQMVPTFNAKPDGTPGIQLSFICQFIVLSPPDAALQTLINQFVVPSLSNVDTIDLTVIFNTLDLDIPTNVEFATVNESIMIRFDPSSPPTDHLASGLQWCIFVNAGVLEDLVDNLINQSAGAQLKENGFSVGNVHTTYMGSQTGNAYLEATLGGSEPGSCAGEHFTVTAAFDFKINMFLMNSPSNNPPQLAKLIWFNLNLTSNVAFDPFGFVEHTLNSRAVEAMASFDVSSIGGTRIGQPGSDEYDHNFEIVSDLPQLSFGNASLSYANGLIAGNDGVVIGGGISYTPAPPLLDLTYAVTKFNPYTYIQLAFCNGLTGPAWVEGNGTLTNTGQLCSATIVSPTSSAAQSVVSLSTSPAPGNPTSEVSVAVFLTVASATIFLSAGNQEHLVVRVQTTRGVRLLDFGAPPTPQYDGNGNLENVVPIFIGCFPIPLSQGLSQIPLSMIAHGSIAPPPSDWAANLESVTTFHSAIITINDVSEGDALILRQPLDGGISVVSAKQAPIQIPVLVAVRPYDEGAVLEKADRSTIMQATIASKVFQRFTVLRKRGALGHRLVGTKSAAQIVTTYENRIEITEVYDNGLMYLRQIIKGKDGTLPRQLVEKKEIKLPQTKLAGLGSVRTVPGFEDSGVYVGQFEDGTLRVISVTEEGAPRVYGTVPRWTNMPISSGDWAISSSVGDRIAVFRIMDMSPKKCECGCHEK